MIPKLGSHWASPDTSACSIGSSPTSIWLYFLLRAQKLTRKIDPYFNPASCSLCGRIAPAALWACFASGCGSAWWKWTEQTRVRLYSSKCYDQEAEQSWTRALRCRCLLGRRDTGRMSRECSSAFDTSCTGSHGRRSTPRPCGKLVIGFQSRLWTLFRWDWSSIGKDHQRRSTLWPPGASASAVRCQLGPERWTLPSRCWEPSVSDNSLASSWSAAICASFTSSGRLTARAYRSSTSATFAPLAPEFYADKDSLADLFDCLLWEFCNLAYTLGKA